MNLEVLVNGVPRAMQMSTSWNLAVWLHEALDDFPADLLRFYLASILPETNDVNFSWREFQERVNSDLIGNLGNYINRTLSFMERYFDGEVTSPEEPSESAPYRSGRLQGAGAALRSPDARRTRPRDALGELLAMGRRHNCFFDSEAPWQSRKEDPEQARETILILLLGPARFHRLPCSSFRPGGRRTPRRVLQRTHSTCLGPHKPYRMLTAPKTPNRCSPASRGRGGRSGREEALRRSRGVESEVNTFSTLRLTPPLVARLPSSLLGASRPASPGRLSHVFLFLPAPSQAQREGEDYKFRRLTMVPKATRKPKTSASTPTITGPRRKPPEPEGGDDRDGRPSPPGRRQVPGGGEGHGHYRRERQPHDEESSDDEKRLLGGQRERHPSGRQQSRTQKGPAVTEAEPRPRQRPAVPRP